MEKNMILGIFGSRSLKSDKSYNFIKSKIEEFVKKEKIEYIVLPGGIKGACESALKILSSQLIPVKLFFYSHEASKWGRIDSIRKRTKDVVNEGDYFLCFHDGISKGTLWDIELLKKKNKKYKYYIIKEDSIEDYEYEEEIFNIDEV